MCPIALKFQDLLHTLFRVFSFRNPTFLRIGLSAQQRPHRSVRVLVSLSFIRTEHRRYVKISKYIAHCVESLLILGLTLEYPDTGLTRKYIDFAVLQELKSDHKDLTIEYATLRQNFNRVGNELAGEKAKSEEIGLELLNLVGAKQVWYGVAHSPYMNWNGSDSSLVPFSIGSTG